MVHATNYQKQVNSLTGALGPKTPAVWRNTMKLSGPAYGLSSQPLYYAPSKGYYVTSADLPASMGSVNFSSAFGRRRMTKRRVSRRKVSKRRMTKRKTTKRVSKRRMTKRVSKRSKNRKM